MARQADVVQSVLIETKITGADQAEQALRSVAKAQDQVSQAADSMAAAQEKIGTRFRTTTPDFDKWRGKIDAVARAEQNYARQEAMGQRFLANGRSIEEVNSVLDIARQRMEQTRTRFGQLGEANDNLTKKIGLQRHEWVNLSRQMQDVVTMGAMGASPMQIATSQGAQFLDIFASAQAGPMAALRAVAPLAGAVTGLAATFGVAAKAAYDFSAGQDEVQRSLVGVGKASGATLGSINRIAEETADAAKQSVASTRQMIASFAATGKIGQDDFAALSVATSRYAKITGTDLPEASAKMAQAMRDPVKGAVELNERLGFLNGTTLTTIERQMAFGDRAGATRTLISAMSGTLHEAASQTNAWSAAIDATIRKLANLYDLTGRKVMGAIAPTDEQQLQSLVDQRGKLSDLSGRGSWWSGLLTIGADKEIAELEDKISDLQERIRRRGAQAMADARTATANQASLQNKSIVDAMTPNAAEMLRLQTWKSSLEEALRLGQGTTQTEASLKRINDLLTAGGQAARDMLRDARSAADQAGMLPVPRARAQAEEEYRRRVEAANGNEALLKNAKDIRDETMRGLDTQSSFVPQRDFGMRIEEMRRSLETQRQAFGQSTEAAETLRAKLDMLNEAARYGQSVTERFGSGWEKAAADMGKAKAAAEELQRAQQNVVQGMDELRTGTRGLMSGALGDIMRGKDPTQSLLNGLTSMTERYVERTVFKPLTEGLLGQDGKPGGGLLGDFFAKSFGATTTGTMQVTAATVIIGGAGVGGASSLIPGIGGSATGAQGQALNPASTIVQSAGGSVLRFQRGGSQSGQGTILPYKNPASGYDEVQGPAYPVSVVTGSPLGVIGPAGSRIISSLDTPTTQHAAPTVSGFSARPASLFPGARTALEFDRLGKQGFPFFGDSVAPFRGNPDMVREAMRGPLEARAKEISEQITGAGSQLTTSIADTASGVGQVGPDLVNSLLSIVTKGGGGGGILGSFLGGGGNGGGFGLGETVTGAFDQGGYTGHGGRLEPAGIVHRGEYVMSAPAVNRIGVQRLDALHRGYADGGYVTPMAPQPVSMPPMHATLPAPSHSSNGHAGPSTVVIDVKGATGNSEIATMVEQGISAAIRANNSDRDRSMRARLANAQRRFG